jgi:hypothetical protein
MSIQDFNLANSSLDVKASGSIMDVSKDLNLPEGKSIAELLSEYQNDVQQETKTKNKN